MPQLDINPNANKKGFFAATKDQIPQLKKPIQMGKVLLVSFLFVGVFAGIVILLVVANQTQNYRKKNFETKISETNQQLALYASVQKKAEALYGQVKNLESIRAQQESWSRLMKRLSANVTKNVKIDSLSIAEDKSVIITGRTKSMSRVGALMTSLEESGDFSQIQLTSLGFDDNSVVFGLKLTYNPSALEVESNNKTNSSN